MLASSLTMSTDSIYPHVVRADILSLQKHFQNTKLFPEMLVTQNSRKMKWAYSAVPDDIWLERIADLETALQSRVLLDYQRIQLVSHMNASLTPNVDMVLNSAFLEKYKELRFKMQHMFNNFFPYRVSRTTPEVMVFSKLQTLELVKYVIERK